MQKEKISQKTKKQHYVPQCYLNAWSIPNTHQVYVYDKELDMVRKNHIQDVASERYFYDINPRDLFSEETINELEKQGFVYNSKEKSQGIERFFAEEIEKPFSVLLHEIIEKASSATPWHIKNCYFISEEKKADFSAYLSFQFIRAKRVRESILDSADCLKQALNDMGATMEVVEKYSISKEEAKNTHIQMIFDYEHLCEIAVQFTSYIWMLGINKTGKKFYTSDNPIVTQAHIKNPILSMNGLQSKRVEVFFPLSSYIILIMFDSTYYTHIRSLERRYIEIVDKANVDYYNSLLALRANRSIFSADENMELIDQMKQKNPSVFKQPHTQVTWGDRTFYPRKGDQQI